MSLISKWQKCGTSFLRRLVKPYLYDLIVEALGLVGSTSRPLCDIQGDEEMLMGGDAMTENESCSGLSRLWKIRSVILLDMNKEMFAVWESFFSSEFCAVIAAPMNTALRSDVKVAVTPSQTPSPGAQAQCERHYTDGACRRKSHCKAGGSLLPERCQERHCEAAQDMVLTKRASVG